MNADLHATLLELSGHATAVRLIHTLNAQTVRYQYRTILIPGRPAASVAEHTAIVEAVVAGRADEAEAAMRQHLFKVADAVRPVCCRAASTLRVAVSSSAPGGARARCRERRARHEAVRTLHAPGGRRVARA